LKTILSLLFFIIFTGNALALDLGEPDGVEIKDLPITGLKMVRTQDGNHFFVSDNARFVIQGRMMDMLNQEEISTFEDVDRVINKVSIDKIKPEDLETTFSYKMGTGPKNVIVFTSPGCPFCYRVLNQSLNLTDLYTFHVLPIPILGQPSLNAVKGMLCASDQDRAKKALLSGDYSKLKETECDLFPVQQSMSMAQIMGVKGVPFIVAPDGRTHSGAPGNLGLFLNGGR
jgi:thiol:disulfide interchange protein DsbC